MREADQDDGGNAPRDTRPTKFNPDSGHKEKLPERGASVRGVAAVASCFCCYRNRYPSVQRMAGWIWAIAFE